MDAANGPEEPSKPPPLRFRQGCSYHPDVHLYEGDKAFEGLPEDFVKLPDRNMGKCITQNYGVPFGEHKTLKDSNDPSKPAVIYLITAFSRDSAPTSELSAQFRMWGSMHRNVRPSDITGLKHDRFDPLKTPLAGYDARTGQINKKYNRRWPVYTTSVVHKHWLARYWMWLFEKKFPDEFHRWRDHDDTKEMFEKFRTKLVKFDDIEDKSFKGKIKDADSESEVSESDDDESEHQGPRVVLRSRTRSRAQNAPTIGNSQENTDLSISDAELENDNSARHHGERDRLKELLRQVDQSAWATYHIHVPKPKQEDLQKLRALRKINLQQFDQFCKTISGEEAQAVEDDLEAGDDGMEMD